MRYQINKTSYLCIVILLLVCEEAPGICAHLLTLFSLLIILVTLPFSLLMVVKVVQVTKLHHHLPHHHGLHQEYERTVIFRLGRLLSGGARGPGVFFIIPCVDIFEKIDLRVQNFDVPPQEVILDKISVQ